MSAATATTRSPRDLGVLDALRSPRRLGIEVLAGIVVGLALIPEAVSFAVIAGVDPAVGLFTSVTMAITTAFVGGRPAMISAATGAVAVVLAPMTHAHGVAYLVPTVLLAGLMQIALGLFGVARLMRFVPRSVVIGFVNSLAVLMFVPQLPHLVGVPWAVYPLVALGMGLIVAWPRLWPAASTAVPAPLIAVLAVTAVGLGAHLNVPTVGDEGELPHSLPALVLPQVPLTLDTLRIIAPYALAMALVGLMESLLTAGLLDDITETRSDKTRESCGQGVANLVTGAFGGMGGCAVIGQSLMNTKVSGARTRISTFVAGAGLLVLCVVLGDAVARVPMAALVAVMLMVCIATVDWHSLRPTTLRRMPLSETIVMVVTMATVVATSNLAIGVIVGTVTAMVAFTRRVAGVTSVTDAGHPDPRTHTYAVTGELFFATSNDLIHHFDYAEDVDRVVLDFTAARLWDASTVATLDAIRTRYAAHGTTVDIVGLDENGRARHDRLSGHLGD